MADGFLSMTEDVENKKNLLRLACSAWNIACFEFPKRHSLVSRYVQVFRETNNASTVACENLREDMEQLIEVKNRLYPHVRVRILDSDIQLLHGKEHVVITSTPFVSNCF